MEVHSRRFSSHKSVAPSYANRAVIYSHMYWPELGNEPSLKWTYEDGCVREPESKRLQLLRRALQGPLLSM